MARALAVAATGTASEVEGAGHGRVARHRRGRDRTAIEGTCDAPRLTTRSVRRTRPRARPRPGMACGGRSGSVQRPMTATTARPPPSSSNHGTNPTTQGARRRPARSTTCRWPPRPERSASSSAIGCGKTTRRSRWSTADRPTSGASCRRRGRRDTRPGGAPRGIARPPATGLFPAPDDRRQRPPCRCSWAGRSPAPARPGLLAIVASTRPVRHRYPPPTVGGERQRLGAHGRWPGSAGHAEDDVRPVDPSVRERLRTVPASRAAGQDHPVRDPRHRQAIKKGDVVAVCRGGRLPPVRPPARSGGPGVRPSSPGSWAPTAASSGCPLTRVGDIALARVTARAGSRRRRPAGGRRRPVPYLAGSDGGDRPLAGSTGTGSRATASCTHPGRPRRHSLLTGGPPQDASRSLTTRPGRRVRRSGRLPGPADHRAVMAFMRDSAVRRPTCPRPGGDPNGPFSRPGRGRPGRGRRT